MAGLLKLQRMLICSCHERECCGTQYEYFGQFRVVQNSILLQNQREDLILRLT